MNVYVNTEEHTLVVASNEDTTTDRKKIPSENILRGPASFLLNGRANKSIESFAYTPPPHIHIQRNRYFFIVSFHPEVKWYGPSLNTEQIFDCKTDVKSFLIFCCCRRRRRRHCCCWENANICQRVCFSCPPHLPRSDWHHPPSIASYHVCSCTCLYIRRSGFSLECEESGQIGAAFCLKFTKQILDTGKEC